MYKGRLDKLALFFTARDGVEANTLVAFKRPFDRRMGIQRIYGLCASDGLGIRFGTYRWAERPVLGGK